MKSIRVAIITLMVFCIQNLHSQNMLPDSIKQDLAKHKDDFSKVQYLQKVSESVFRSNPSLNHAVLNKAHSIAEQTEIDTLLIDVQIKLGIYYLYSDKQDSALYWYEDALLKIKVLNDSLRLATLYGELGVYYYRLSNVPMALENFIRSYDIAEVLNDVRRLAGLSNNIGNVYRYLGEIEKSKEFTLRSIDYKTVLKDSSRMASSYHNLGITYDMLDETDSALHYFKLSEWYKVKFNNLRGLSGTYVSLSEVFNKKGSTDSAFYYLDKAIEMDRKLNYMYGLGYDLNSRAKMYYDAGNMKLALDDVTESLDIAEDARLIKDATTLIADVYEQLQEYKWAAYYRKEYATFSDSLHLAEKEASLQEMQVKFETDLKDREIVQLENVNKIQQLQSERDRQFRLLLIATSLLLIIATGALYYRYKTKARTNQLLDTKNKELEDLNFTKDRLFSIISHDLKSPLSSFHTITRSLTDNWENLGKDQLKEFIESLRDSSKEVHDMMDNLLRWALAQTGQLAYKPEIVNPALTMDEIKKQLSSPLQASGIELNVQMDNIDNLKVDNDYLKLILRNLVSNAIKFSKIDSTIEIMAEDNQTHKSISIKDYGVGIKKEDLDKLFGENSAVHEIQNSANKGTGLGLTLCKELMEKMGGKIEVESEFEKGTTFRLIFPKAA